MGGGAGTLVRQPKTAVFLEKSPKPGGSQSVKPIMAFKTNGKEMYLSLLLKIL